jgi:hypothetical protein
MNTLLALVAVLSSSGDPDLPLVKNGLSPVKLVEVVHKAGFPEQYWGTAVAICLAESKGLPTALYIGKHDESYGLFQINLKGEKLKKSRLTRYKLKSERDLFNPHINARVAYHISGGGKKWGAWSVYRSSRSGNSYRSKISLAREAVSLYKKRIKQK